MRSAETLKNFIAGNIDGFAKGKNILVGSIDISRHEAEDYLCVVVPERTEMQETYGDGSYQAETTFTLSFLFRGAKHSVLVERMERTAETFMRKVMTDLALGEGYTAASIGGIEYFYDCGTVRRQASGLDIEMTVTETKK